MRIRRTSFFLSLFCIVFILFSAHRLIWLMQSKKIMGVFAFRGQGNALEQIRLPFTEIYFTLGTDTVWFKGPGNLQLQPGTPVAVRYLPRQPADAKVCTFFGVWGGPATYGGIAFLMLLVIFLHPAIIPRRANIQLTAKKPFIKIV